MKFKVDENLPIEIAEFLRQAGYDALTVVEQNLRGEGDSTIILVCQQEERILITLDLDFTDIRTYPPNQYAGILVFRVKRQDKFYLISLFQKLLPRLTQEAVARRLWIIEESQIRIRE